MPTSRSFPTIVQYIWAHLRDTPERDMTVGEIAEHFCITRRSVVGKMPYVMALDYRVNRVRIGVYRFNPGPAPDPDPEILYRQRGGGEVEFHGLSQVEMISDFLEESPGKAWSVEEISNRTGIKRRSVAGQMGAVLEFNPRIERVARGIYWVP